MAADTVRAAAACPAVAAVVVVTDDPAAATALGALGARVVADEPDAGLNPALAHGATVAAASWPEQRHRGAGRGPARAAARGTRPGAPGGRAVAGGVRGRRGGQRHHAVRGPPRGRRSGRVSARDQRPGTGTGGATEIGLPDVPSLRSDVDTPADLQNAITLGVGPRTAELAAQIR